MGEASPAVYTIDPHTLREVVTNERAVLDRVAQLERRGTVGNAERTNLLRMLGRLEEAEPLARRVLWRIGGVLEPELHIPSGAILAAVRLAAVWQWQGHYAQADELYLGALDAVARAEIPPGMNTGFVRQHYGTSLFDQGHVEAALDQFTRALEVRRSVEVPADQIGSSLLAVTTAASLVEGRRPAGPEPGARSGRES